MSQPEYYLTTEEMVVVGQTFIDSVNHVLGHYDQQGQNTLRQFMATLTMTYKPYLMVTPEGVAKMMEFVWRNPGHQDFVLMVSYTFFSRWAQPEAKFKGLAAALARGVALVERSPDSAVPKQAGDRLADINAASQAIATNKWLMVALMIPLFFNTAQSTGTPNRP